VPRPVRIATCSGFYGDHLAAAREMLAGPIDVLTRPPRTWRSPSRIRTSVRWAARSPTSSPNSRSLIS